MIYFYIQVHIEFTEGEDKIQVEGPPEEVEQAVSALENYVRGLVCFYLPGKIRV